MLKQGTVEDVFGASCPSETRNLGGRAGPPPARKYMKLLMISGREILLAVALPPPPSKGSGSWPPGSDAKCAELVRRDVPKARCPLMAESDFFHQIAAYQRCAEVSSTPDLGLP